MMDPAALNAWMDRYFTCSAFRFEARQAYEVASDGSDFRRWLDGELTWTPERKQPWLDHLAAEKARGLRRSRVRLITRPVTDYTRYACEWGYAPNMAAGEGVQVLDLGERDLPDLPVAPGDWWLVADEQGGARVVLMYYGDDGSFLGADDIPGLDVSAYVAARDILRAVAEPFPSWWERHPELRRAGTPLWEPSRTG